MKLPNENKKHRQMSANKKIIIIIDSWRTGAAVRFELWKHVSVHESTVGTVTVITD